MTSEQRLDRLERIATLMARAGLRTRNKVREHDQKISILLDAQMRTEEALFDLLNLRHGLLNLRLTRIADSMR